MRVVCTYVCACVCVRVCVCMVNELGINSVHTFDCVSPCSTHCLRTQWSVDQAWELCVHNWPVNLLSSAVLVQQWFGVRLPVLTLSHFACSRSRPSVYSFT